MFSYPKAAMERAMKVQEVILRALAKKITWWQAAEIIGISDRQMRRWRHRGLRVTEHACHVLLPSPSEKRTDHVLSQPDISCANDIDDFFSCRRARNCATLWANKRRTCVEWQTALCPRIRKGMSSPTKPGCW